jgi:hypothetical protein
VKVSVFANGHLRWSPYSYHISFDNLWIIFIGSTVMTTKQTVQSRRSQDAHASLTQTVDILAKVNA